MLPVKEWLKRQSALHFSRVAPSGVYANGLGGCIPAQSGDVRDGVPQSTGPHHIREVAEEEAKTEEATTLTDAMWESESGVFFSEPQKMACLSWRQSRCPPMHQSTRRIRSPWMTRMAILWILKRTDEVSMAPPRSVTCDAPSPLFAPPVLSDLKVKFEAPSHPDAPPPTAPRFGEEALQNCVRKRRPN